MPPLEHHAHYVPSATPGCLAPHAWLADGSSLYDHFGPGLTLLETDGGDGEPMAHARAPCHSAAPPSPADPRLRRHYRARFVLIRPDQHVAWRGDELPVNPESLLLHVTGRHLRTLDRSTLFRHQ